MRAARTSRLLLAASLTLLLVCDLVFAPPTPGIGQKASVPQAQVVLARDGTPLRAFPDQTHVWRHPVRVAEVSPRYVQALLTYEDRFFHWHPGVNPFALLRAAAQWLTQGHIVSGGSTLTMQVARLLEPQAYATRSVSAKLRQAARALQLELRLSKAEILELYLTYAPMGGVLEGVEAASRAYHGKSALALSHAEAALLAVLPQAPSRLRPDRFADRARAARDKVLERLLPLWGAEVVADAKQEPVVVLTVREPQLAPLFAQRVRKLYPGMPRVDTTLDVGMQASVEQLIAARLAVLPPRVSMAVLVVENGTLAVRAYAGSADFSDSERFSHVDMVQGLRSPGSALKPLLYGLALDEGLIHSESLLTDAPQSFGGYQPGNFQANFSGPVSATEALQRSLNVPAVEVLDRIGPQRFVALLRRGGLKLELPRGAEPNLSVILGGAAVSLEQLVGAYTAFARQGIAAKPRYTANEPLVEQRLLSDGAAFIVRDMLESGGPVARAVDAGVGTRRGIMWKTGTSFGFRDAWAVGVSDQLTVGIWVGRPDGTPNPGFFGANVAAPMLVDVFSAVEAPAPMIRTPPASVTQGKVCWPLGLLADSVPTPLCHQTRTAWLLNASAPPTFPDRLRSGAARFTDHRDSASGLRVRAACAPADTMAIEMARWPVAVEPWLDASVRARAIAPAWHPACAAAATPDAGPRIVGLSPGEVLRRAGHAHDAPWPQVRLDARASGRELIWLIDGRQVARATAGRSVTYRFETPGLHTITAMDDAGHFDRIEVRVR